MRKACHIKFNRCMALLIVLCLMLSAVSSGLFVSHASGLERRYQIGDHVTASLSESGLLSIEGAGGTYDYLNTDGNRAPFYQERQLITKVEIADGVTSIGDYLFYNCENLGGTLTLPPSVIIIGERAFSGDSAESAPAFTYLSNQFVEADILTETSTAQEPAIAPKPRVEQDAGTGTEPGTEPETNEEPGLSGGESAIDESAQNAGSQPGAKAAGLIPETGSSGEPAPADNDPQSTVSYIAQQELGEEIFFPGQLGVFECAEGQNQSFITAAGSAGYVEILSRTAVSFGDSFETSVSYEAPVTRNGIFLPSYEETGLPSPENPGTAYRFAGWKASGKDGGALEAHSFCILPEASLTALWESAPRGLTPQTISKAVGTRLVEISGNLPEGAEVSAEEAPLTDELLGLVSQATGSDTPEIFFALDIAILVDGARYQPNEYGESVTVNIRNIENLPGKDVSVLHLTENEQTRQLDLVESLAPQSLSEDTLEFTAESFSLYVAAKSAARNTVAFDLAQGPVVLGESYSGYDSEGNTVTGPHKTDNYYIVTQSDAATATANGIKFEGNNLTFQVELAGVNISKTFVSGDGTDAAIEANSSIFIPAYSDNVKHITLYLSGNNSMDNIAYYTYSADDLNGGNTSASTLKITSAAGDGSLEGALAVDATERGRYTGIGGTGSRSPATGLTLAGGTVTAASSDFEAAIGGGSNGYADIRITGGYITATKATGNAAAIGSGGGGSAAGANAKIEITGGTVIASNQGALGVAIGAGGLSSTAASPGITAGKADIVISGGTVAAYAASKNAISGGYNETAKDYAATTVQINGGSVTGTITGTPTADGTTEVQQTAVTLKSNGTPQADIAVDAFTLSSGAYGANDVKTDENGKLFLWLPVGTAVTTAQAGIYAFAGSVASGGSGDLTNGTVVFDLANGPVVLGADYSGKDSAGGDVAGAHNESNYYIIKQSNPETATTNTVTFAGDGLSFQVVLDNINVDRIFTNTGDDNNRATDSSIYIPAYPGAEKHVTLYLSGENKLNTICYYTIDDDSRGTGEGRSASTLKITSAAGDGKQDGSLAIDATKKGRFSCIGATGDKSTATGLTIAGGTITAKNSGAEACIGGGSNGFAEITVTGGRISATQNGNVPAIGSGSGTNAVGADAEITISGGVIFAENINAAGVAIGAGGSSKQIGGHASVTISGGNITAKVTGGTAIGGGNSIDLAGGGADVSISGGTVTTGGVIGGGFSDTFGYAEAAIAVTGGSLDAMMSKTPTNGGSNVYLTRATLYDADQRVTDSLVDTINAADYGMKDVRTDGNGTLYLWLPENTELTQATANGNEFTGSILAKSAGILKYNSAKAYYSVHFPYDDRFTVYADAERTTAVSGTQTVPAGDVLFFWVQAKTYDSGGYYDVDAYRSADSSMASFPAESSQNGLYAYALTVTSNTELLFVTRAENETPRVSLDISTVNATINSDSVTIGGYTLPEYTGDFLLTSGGLPTSHMLMVKDGAHAIHIDRLVAQRSGNVIQVDSGAVSATASSFNNNLVSTGYSAILVQKGAVFDLSVSGSDSLYISSSGTAYSPIGGSGEIGITQNGGFLTLSSGGSEQITAQSYTYTTNSLTGALPYSVKLTAGALAGYHDGSKLTAAGAAHTISSQTTFTACAVSYALPNGAAAPTHSITANGDLAVLLSDGMEIQSVKRDGADINDYSADSNTLTIHHSAAYGSLEITLRKEGNISCKAEDYSAEYTGNAHTFMVTVGYPAQAKVQYSTDNLNWSETPPTMTDAGSKTVYWKITATAFTSLEGENSFTVTKGTNHWTADLTCPSVQFGSAPNPRASAKWGAVAFSYYAAADLSQPLSETPKEAGSYYVKASVAGTGNYDTLESEFVPFTIETTVIYSTTGKILDRLTTKDGVPISTAVSAAADSAFTVSYGFFYIPNSASTPLTLEFSEALPEGTKLTMLDLCLSHGDKPRFFYYLVPDGGAASVKSTDFYQMGSTAPGTFENADAATAREVQYQLCVEFPPNTTATGDLTIRLTQGGKEIDKTMVTVTRTAPVSAGTLSLFATAGQRQLSAAAKVSGASGGNNVLAVSLLDSAGNPVSFPAGSSITLEGREPTVTRSSFAAFDGIGNGNYSISITGLPAGSYQLKADLCAAPEKPAYPLADSVSGATVKGLAVTAQKYAIRAELANGQSRVVDAAGAKLVFSVAYVGSGDLVVSSQRKADGSYTDLAQQWTASGAGTLSGSPASIAVTVPENTPPGTYRLVFQLGDAKFPYNIIVE